MNSCFHGIVLAGLLAHSMFNTFPSNTDSGMQIEQGDTITRIRVYSYGDSSGI